MTSLVHLSSRPRPTPRAAGGSCVGAAGTAAGMAGGALDPGD